MGRQDGAALSESPWAWKTQRLIPCRCLCPRAEWEEDTRLAPPGGCPHLPRRHLLQPTVCWFWVPSPQGTQSGQAASEW